MRADARASLKELTAMLLILQNNVKPSISTSAHGATKESVWIIKSRVLNCEISLLLLFHRRALILLLLHIDGHFTR